MKDYAINPITRDYEISAGKPTMTQTIMNNIYFSLITKKGSFIGDKNFGSNLHLLKREKSLNRVAILAKEYAESALAWIIKLGRATQIVVSTEIDKQNGRLLCLVTAEQNGKTIKYEHFIEVK